MAALGDFVDSDDDGGEVEELHLMNIEYEEQYGKPVTHMWTRDKDDTERHVEVVGHRPSLYIREDAYSKRVKNHTSVEKVESGYNSIHGDDLVRVYTKLPGQIGGDNDSKGLRDHFSKTWEADIFYCNRFLIDTGIKTHFEVDLEETYEPSACKGDYRVNVDDISPIEEAEWRSTPRTITVDIEVESPDGFPDPRDARQPVTAITAHDNYDDAYTVWVLRHGDWEMTDTEVENLIVENRPDTISVDDVEVRAAIDDGRVFSDEATMLDDFNDYIIDHSPDLLGGYNSSTTDKGYPFDYPYLINRCKNLNTLSYRDWSPLGQVWSSNWGPRAKGVEFHDMMKAYKKTQWSKPNGGYSLENISDKELSTGKMEIDDIDNAWRDEPATFLEYNIRDVQAVVGIDVSADVTTLFQNLRRLTGAQWGDCHNNIDLLDHFILRYAKDFGVVLPTNVKPDRGWYYGAYVFTPKFGRHKNAVYPDLWSMYPNMIRNCNMSPETIIGTKEKLEASEYTEEDCRWTYIDTRPTNVKYNDGDPVPPEYTKCYFVKPSIKEGFMTKVVDDLMGLKDAYDGTPLYGPVKQIVNSVYGVYGDSDSYGKGYRLFDWRIAEGICLGGRKMIQDSSDRFATALNNLKDEKDYDGRNAYRVGGDTDSVMTSIPFMPSDTREQMEEIVALAHDAADRVNEWYDEWTEEMFNLEDGDHYCELEIESYSPWLYIPAPATKKAEGKKRYVENTKWEEGDWYDTPQFSATGVDIVRSDKAEVTREVAQEIVEAILNNDDPETARKEAYDAMKSTAESIKEGDVQNSYIARPKGMGQSPDEYGSATRRPSSTYRGAKYANKHFDWERMGEGSKPQWLAVERVRGEWPKTYTADTAEDGDVIDSISAEKPDKIPDEFVIDYDTMIDKTMRDPFNPLIEPMNWDFDEALADSEQAGITAFM